MSVMIEHVSSRRATVSPTDPRAELILKIVGTESDFEVRALVETFLPYQWNDLVLQEYTHDHEGAGIWEVVASYGRMEPRGASGITGAGDPSLGGSGHPGQEGRPQGGGNIPTDLPQSSRFSFDTTGGTIKITHGRSIVASYGATKTFASGTNLDIDAEDATIVFIDFPGYTPSAADIGRTLVITGGVGFLAASYEITNFGLSPNRFILNAEAGVAGSSEGTWELQGPATPPDHGGAINVNEDGEVEGVEITSPTFKFTETFYKPVAEVTTAYMKALADLTGTVNLEEFRTFPHGEVLFLGASGAQRDLTTVELTFNFARNPNLSNFEVGGITVAEKRGWDHLWVEYERLKDDNAKKMVTRPLAVHVDVVYQYADWEPLGIGE